MKNIFALILLLSSFTLTAQVKIEDLNLRSSVDGTQKIPVGGPGRQAINSDLLKSYIAGNVPVLVGINSKVGTRVQAPTAYEFGFSITVINETENTGGVDVNFNSLGAKTVLKNGNVALASGDMKAGTPYVLVYDGTNFQIIGVGDGGGGGGGDITGPEVIAALGYTPENVIGVTLTGTNTKVGTATPSPGSYQTNQKFLIYNSSQNTGPVTVNLNGLGARALTKNGTTPLINSDLHVGFYLIAYDGTRFQIVHRMATATNGLNEFAGVFKLGGNITETTEETIENNSSLSLRTTNSESLVRVLRSLNGSQNAITIAGTQTSDPAEFANLEFDLDGMFGIGSIKFVDGRTAKKSIELKDNSGNFITNFSQFTDGSFIPKLYADERLLLKANLAGGNTFTGTQVLPSTTSIGNVSNTELGFLDGVTSAIQTQFDEKINASGTTTITDPIISGHPLFQGTIRSSGTTAASSYFASLGKMTMGGYGAVGSNFYLDASGFLKRTIADSFSAIEFLSGGFVFKNAGSGAIGSTITPISLATINSIGEFSHTMPSRTSSTNVYNQTGTFAPTSGIGTYNGVSVSATYNTTASYSGIGRGVYVSHTLTNTTGLDNRAWEHTDGYIAWNSVLTPSQITSNQDDYNPTGWTNGGAPAGASIVRLSTDASRNLTSLAGGQSGRLVILVNAGSQNIVIKDDDGSTGTAANRFALSADITLLPDDSKMFFYDATSSRWRALF